MPNNPLETTIIVEHPTEPNVRSQVRGPPLPNRLLTLRVRIGPELARFVLLEPGQELILGRDDSVDFLLGDVSVSRRHSRLLTNPDGSAVIEDLNSTNGTRVNGQLIEQATVWPGDDIEIGNVLLRYDAQTLDEVAHIESVLVQLEAPVRDGTTGLKPREWLEAEIGALRSRGQVVGVSVEVERLPSLVQRYGASNLERMLRELARLLMLHVRGADIGVRWGEGTLLVLLTDTDPDSGPVVLARLERVLREHPWGRSTPGLIPAFALRYARPEPHEPLPSWARRLETSEPVRVV